MELDSRIKEGKKPLTCFDAKKAQNFVGKKCYLTNDISIFTDLDTFKEFEGCSCLTYDGIIDTLTNINTEVSMVFETTYLRWKFCLPCEWVKPEESEEPEKTYRPYTVMEFIKEYPLGSHLHFRPKDKLIEMHRLIDGYNDCLNGAGTLFMCGMMYSMSELYDRYEIFKDGEWVPFGIEIGER